MHILRKYRKKAKNQPLVNHEDKDKNDQPEKTVEFECDIENATGKKLADSLNVYMIKMLNLIREIALFCFIFVAYAAITNEVSNYFFSPPKISKAPAAYPFFSKDSHVTDWYRGQIISSIEQARTTDISFIMFYAPWDAESQAAKKEFEATASYMRKYVLFAAINCWQPGSECRNHYNKVYRWPVLIAYPSFGTGIQYNGPISAPQMISFLQKLMKPIKRAGDNILHFEEAFLVAELNALPGTTEYSIYYSAALKYLEEDPLARVSFYVKPVKSSKLHLSLYLWDQVRNLDLEKGDWKVENIIQWVLKNLDQASSWVAPSGSKSLLLSSHLQPGPSLILFTPKNALHQANDYYMMLQEIAQEYKNCDSWILNFNMQGKRLSNLLDYSILEKSCSLTNSRHKMRVISPILPSTVFLNASANLNHAKEKIEVDCSNLCLENKGPHTCQSMKMKKCVEILPQLPKIFDEEIFDKNSLNFEELYYATSMLQETDTKSMESLSKSLQKERCRNFLTAQKIQPAIFESKKGHDTENIDMSGLACKTNQSLDFIAMDSLLYFNFAERLGINLSKKYDRSAVVIINEKTESHYILQDPITSINIKKFILNFTQNKLQRSLKSSLNVDSKNTYSYPFKDNSLSNKTSVVIEELNSENFLRTVLQDNKAVIILYHSKQCSHCSGISHTFLSLARKFSYVENLKFARIDGDLNSLPWEYTMEQYPTVLFFPPRRKEESRVFPSELFITIPNLLGFLFTNLDPALKLHAMYSVCLQNQFQKDRKVCLSTIRNETVSLIENALKDWRKANNRQRRILLYNLKLLRQLQFLFSHTPNEFKLIGSYLKKLNSLVTHEYKYFNVTKRVKDEL